MSTDAHISTDQRTTDERIIDAVREFRSDRRERYGRERGPTYPELAERLHISHRTVEEHVQRLIREGRLSRTRARRSLRIP